MAGHAGGMNFSQRNRLELARKMGMEQEKGVDVSRYFTEGVGTARSRSRGRERRRSDQPMQKKEVRRNRLDSREAKRRREEWDPKKALRELELKNRAIQEEQERKEAEDRKWEEIRRREAKEIKRGSIGLGSLGSVQPREVEVMPVIEQVRIQEEKAKAAAEREMKLPTSTSKLQLDPEMDVDARIAAIEAMVDKEIDDEEDVDAGKNDEEGPEGKKDEDGNFNLKEWRKQRKLRQEEEERARRTKKKKRKEKKVDVQEEDLEEDDRDRKREDLSDESSRSGSPPPAEKPGKIMTEAEVLAMVKKGRKVERGSEKARLRIAKENAEWADMKKWKPMDAPAVNLAFASTIKKEDGSQLRTAAQKFLNSGSAM